jgi:hypothetical protein
MPELETLLRLGRLSFQVGMSSSSSAITSICCGIRGTGRSST